MVTYIFEKRTRMREEKQMKKLGKKVALALAGVMIVGVLGGCGNSFDASKYLQAILDNSYKNDSSAIVEMKIGTKEEATAIYEQGMDAQIDMMTASVNLTEEQKTQYKELYANIFGQAKYTVGEAEKQEDGSYVVTVSYEQMNIFEPAMTAYLDKVAQIITEMATAQTQPTDEELKKEMVDALRVCMEESLNHVTYEEVATTTVRIEVVDKEWKPNEEDIQKLTNLLFDNEDATNGLMQ